MAHYQILDDSCALTIQYNGIKIKTVSKDLIVLRIILAGEALNDALFDCLFIEHDGKYSTEIAWNDVLVAGVAPSSVENFRQRVVNINNSNPCAGSGGGGGGVQSVTGETVDETDPANPVILPPAIEATTASMALGQDVAGRGLIEGQRYFCSDIPQPFSEYYFYGAKDPSYSPFGVYASYSGEGTIIDTLNGGVPIPATGKYDYNNLYGGGVGVIEIRFNDTVIINSDPSAVLSQYNANGAFGLLENVKINNLTAVNFSSSPTQAVMENFSSVNMAIDFFNGAGNYIHNADFVDGDLTFGANNQYVDGTNRAEGNIIPFSNTDGQHMLHCTFAAGQSFGNVMSFNVSFEGTNFAKGFLEYYVRINQNGTHELDDPNILFTDIGSPSINSKTRIMAGQYEIEYDNSFLDASLKIFGVIYPLSADDSGTPPVYVTYGVSSGSIFFVRTQNPLNSYAFEDDLIPNGLYLQFQFPIN